MSECSSVVADEQILDAMLLLARATKSQRIIVAGPNALDLYLGLLQRGFSRAATPATSRFPYGQHDVALLAGHYTIQALQDLIDRVVPYLNTRASLSIWRGNQDLAERLGFRVEAGTRCESGFIVSAQRQQLCAIPKAA